jgi:capsular polysaccharide biosynthesis protein
MDLSNLIKQKRQTLFSIFLVFLVVGLLVVLVQDFKYGAKSKVLVIQEGAGRVDPFAVSRSVEYLSDLFTRVVYSNAFFEDTMNSDYNIDKSYFGDNSVNQMKRWERALSAKEIGDSGIINMTVYHPDNYQAGQIALAINNTLITNHQGYHGLGSSVKVSVIDQPVVSNYPVKPNLLYSLLIIVAASLFFGLIYIYLFPEKKYNIDFFSSNREERRERKEKRRKIKREEKEKKEREKKQKKERFVVKKDFIPNKNIVEEKKPNENDVDISGNIDNLFE